MALTDKLTAIANAIRAKSGKTAPLTLAEMPTEIEALSAEEIIKHAEIPDYVKKEALEVANKVRTVQMSDSVVFLAMSDTHYYGTQGESGVDSYVDADGVQGNTSNLHGGMGAKVLAYALNCDFMIHLGDAAWGHKTTPSALLNSQFDTIFDIVAEAHANLPCFHAIGNHDTGIYYHNNMISSGNIGIYTESGMNLYNKFTARSASSNTVFGKKEYGGYCYKDFDSKKLRVFLLNTSESLVYNQTDDGALGSQRLWFANALLDLNTKSNASEWRCIALSHYPADYGGAQPIAELLKAYVTGGIIAIPLENGTTSTVNFSGKNSAKFIAQFHGHVHNFITSKLHSTATGSPIAFDAWRVCIPNGQYNRENYYTIVNGINFADDKTYLKTPNTANDTSFVVNVINPSEEKIYSFCYGAGYDRVIGFGSVSYYSISRTLTGVTTNNTDVSIEHGKSLSETITLNSGYDMKSIVVTMDGVDISSSAISIVDGTYKISIPNVTGNVVITAKAQPHPNFTNLVPLSINADGTDYNVDGDGYDNGVYISSSGMVASAGYVTTGFIPVKSGVKTIRVAGDGITFNDSTSRFAFYNSNFAMIRNPWAATNLGVSEWSGVITEESSTAITFTADSNFTDGTSAVYIRVSAKGDGENLIVTVDEEITYGGTGGGDTDISYAVVQNLTNITSSNNAPNVTAGSSFSTTLTANSGYELGSVTVMMGGIDVTSSAYSSGKISISSVTGNIVIMATANAVQTSYTNQLPISTDKNGNIYNGIGYKANTYLADGEEGTRDGVYTTGFIPVKGGDTMYFKNCTIQAEQRNDRFSRYGSDKVAVAGATQNTTSSQISLIGTPTYGTDGMMKSLKLYSGGSMDSLRYIRFCCRGLDATSIVTVNEPIN